MLKRTIKFKDFNDEDSEGVFYFNLSKPELVELAVEEKGGMAAFLQRIIDEKDNKELVKRFKEIILMAYGQKSDDGLRFIKNDELREEFEQTAAFQSLFMELMEVEDAAAEFIEGVLPKGMVQDQDKPASPSPAAN